MKFLVVWFQRKEAMAYAHHDGGQLIWSSRRKGATEFGSELAAKWFMQQFINHQSLLAVLEA